MCRRNIQIGTRFRCLYGLRSRQVLFSGGADGGEHVLGVSGSLGCSSGELILDRVQLQCGLLRPQRRTVCSMCRRKVQISTGIRCLHGVWSRQVLSRGGADIRAHVLGVSDRLGCGSGELLLDGVQLQCGLLRPEWRRVCSMCCRNVQIGTGIRCLHGLRSRHVLGNVRSIL